ncbi:MAG: hypothetical protein ACYS0E_22160 [Planctomycetota bacterium]
MNRMNTAHWLGMLLVGAICVTPAWANDDEASLRQQLDDLKQQVDSTTTPAGPAPSRVLTDSRASRWVRR